MFNLSKDEITFEVVEDFCREWQEGVRVEYKQKITSDVPKTVSSFANTQGGLFIIGVRENEPNSEEPYTIEGIPNTGGIEEGIVQSSVTGIYPPIMPEVIIIRVPDTEKVVVVVRVDESPHAPHAIQNSTKVYIRFGSITQPYEKPELADLNRIEYLFIRRQDESVVIEQNLNQMENRAKQFCSTDETVLTLVARPVFLYRPVISPSRIYDLYIPERWIRTVPGGILYVLPSGTEIYEVNEYGIVYHNTLIREDDQFCIQFLNLLEGIYYFKETAKKLYNNCDYFGNIEVSAQMHNV